MESRTQGSRPRPRTQKKSEAKDSLSEDRHSRGQGQECSRPRPRTKDTSASAFKKYFTFFNFNKNAGHLLPNRSPVLITFFLVIIETISSLIRPFSLGIRLISNITSGHLIINLCSNLSFFLMFFLNFIRIFCFVSFNLIFFLLLNIYYKEYS